MSAVDDGIFASPLEPLFNNDYHSVGSDLLQECLLTIAKSNIKDIKSSKDTQFLFSNGGWCESIFLLCERFGLPWQAKFAALDLLDRFMLKHVQDLFQYVQASNSQTKKEDWASILERITKQAFFRMVTCCQIASKLNSHYKVITVKRVRRCLLEAGYSYTIESILQSEMRVLKTLSYQVSKYTCVDFVEIILEILGRNCVEEESSIKAYHDLSVKILTLVYIKQDEIYDNLYLNVAKLNIRYITSTEDQQKLAAVKCDKMLLAVCVIAVAVYIINQSHTAEVIRNLNIISEVPIEDIEDFVKVILQHIQDNNRGQGPHKVSSTQAMEF